MTMEVLIELARRASLTSNQTRVMALIHVEGLGYERAGELLGRTMIAVLKVHGRALRRIQKAPHAQQLWKEGPLPDDDEPEPAGELSEDEEGRVLYDCVFSKRIGRASAPTYDANGRRVAMAAQVFTEQDCVLVIREGRRRRERRS